MKLQKLYIVLLQVLGLCACSKDIPTLTDASIIHGNEFGNFYVDISVDDFDSLGFNYGDSVDVISSNSFKFTDIPYYDGYYVKTNEKLVCAYPGYKQIKVQNYNGSDLFVDNNFDGTEKASIILNTKGKYLT